MKHTIASSTPVKGGTGFPVSILTMTNRSCLLNPQHSSNYTIGRHILEAILAQEGCEGIRFYNATDHSGPATLVFLGVDKNNQLLLPDIPTSIKNSHPFIPIVGDKIKPAGTVLEDDIHTDWGIPD